ncbi:MAG TPA: KEOPS complex subunit Pcc1 [Thermoplasmata archaeon]|jgi:KEOPS complex subunit Pcc1|nr:KEOPS complex subunit Pcc1 [Thermoplasmata archaeon]
MRALLAFHGTGADVVRASLSPEAGREIPRSRVTVQGAGDVAEVLIEAEDSGALRAALNSYLRWSQVALDVRAAVNP